MSSSILRAVIATAPLLVGATGEAGELSLDVRASAGSSDNVFRTSSNEDSSTLLAPGMDIVYAAKTGRLEASANGALDYVTYSTEGLDDQLAGTFNGRAAFAIVPEMLVWDFSDSYGQGRANEFEPSTPENSQGLNYFTTGPEVTLDLSRRFFLTASATYANAWYEEEDGDSNQYGAGFALGRTLSGQSNLRLSTQYVKTSYMQDMFAPDYDTWEYFLSYATKGARGSFDIDLGYRSLDDDTDTQGGTLLRFKLSRSLSPYATVSLRAGEEFSDSARQLGADLSMPSNPGATTGSANGQPFVDTYGGLGFEFTRLRTRLRASATYHDEDYVEAGLDDVQRWDVSGYLERDFTPRFSGGLDVAYYDETRDDVDGSNSEINWGLNVNWQFARTVGATLEWTNWGASTTGEPDVHENQYWLRLNWTAIDRQGGGAAPTPTQEPMPPPPGS